MNELYIEPSLLVLAIAMIIQRALNLLSFIKALKNKKELNAIIANGVAKGNSIISVLSLEAIIIIVSLYIYKWDLLNVIKSPAVVMYLAVPIFSFFIRSGFYYIKVWYLNRVLHTIIR